MSKYLFLLAAAVLAGCSASDTSKVIQAGTASLTPIPELSAYGLGEPISAGKLTVVPVIAKEDLKIDQEYATLAEAKKHGWIEIVEKPGYETVETLLVRNTGPKPILLLGGELLLGGKQDRVVAKDIVVPAGESREVSVYCVEHGRWSGETTSFKYSGAMVPQSVREQATYGDQSKVWEGVAKYNDMAGAPAARSGSVMRGLSAPEVDKQVSSDVRDLLAKLNAKDRVVGMVVAINGEIKAFEVFGDSRLFQSASEALLRGFLADAATLRGSDAKAKDLSIQECARFVASSLNSRRRLVGETREANSFHMSDGDVKGVELGGKSYEAKPATSSEGLLHGSYVKSEEKK